MIKTSAICNMDCLEGIKNLPDDSIDLICTDPPYGISFMGKKWDKALPSIEIWQECLRILKPGAFAFVMCIPRQDCLSRMIIKLEDAGFRVNFTPIFWTFASGFPKASNIGKMVDKRNDIEREVIGEKKGTYADIRRDKKTGITGLHGGSATNKPRIKSYITAPATPQAKKLDGSYGGFQPKPAVECIIVAMKPIEHKTFVDQAMDNGKGITWLDDGRIPYKGKGDKPKASTNPDISGDNYGQGKHNYNKRIKCEVSPQGRFPANILVSGDILNDGINRKSGFMTGKQGGFGNSEIYGDSNKAEAISYNDSGSFSRYFSLDAWAIKNLPPNVQKTFPFLIVSKPSKREKNKGCEGMEDKIGGGMQGTQDKSLKTGSGNIQNNKMKNNHPTCKPVKLMSYLITVGSRPRDIILDPFCGSGTTCIAAKILARKYIGYEISKDYCEIAKARLKILRESDFPSDKEAII